ncbi:MAG: BolA/IbaG family iron-sulfur metabolism protein [Porticoccaceae bacterium]|nr:BolA/IbaG family iron-sulfur metabolism protein [Porticoccaceae bacterium]
MDIEEIKRLLQAALLDCEISVESDGSHLNVTVIGEVFAGKRAVQRQQLVYAALTEQIASGEVHAVNMKLCTPAEWQAA